MSQQKPSPTSPSPLWCERTGTRQYVARNGRGAELTIGYGEGEFTPGELLKLALAGCNATSSDATLAHALGEDYRAMLGVSAEYSKEEDRFISMEVELVADMSAFEPAARERLQERTAAAIGKRCTVGHTLSQATPNSVTITCEGE